MDRFTLSDSSLASFAFGEFQVASQNGVRLYDGNYKTEFDSGELTLTSHRLLWRDSRHSLVLRLELIVQVEEESGGIMGGSGKIVLHLAQPQRGGGPSPSSHGGEIVKLSFKSGGQRELSAKLRDALAHQQWKMQQVSTQPSLSVPRPAPVSSSASGRVIRSGLAGIERSMEAKAKATDTQISKAFEDLDQLMEMAKPMVALAKNISGKIREKQGEVSDDETVAFKSYLLSLGIDDPVTRETHGSGQSYYRELSKEVCRVLDAPVKDAGGMMTLTDAFCRLNRARGLELVSPDDLLNACAELNRSGSASLTLHTFDGTGVMALRSSTHEESALVAKTASALASSAPGGLTAEDLSRSAGVSVVLAKERMLSAERAGVAVRDDSVEGLRFYTNRFLNSEE